MSQGLFKALFAGAKDTQAAKKVIKFVAYFGFTTIGLGTIILFIPFEPMQTVLNDILPEKWLVITGIVFSIMCFVFLLKEKFWAPCLLIALTLGDMILTYYETKGLPGALGSIQLILYGSAAQSIYFLNKQKKEQSIVSTAQNT